MVLTPSTPGLPVTIDPDATHICAVGGDGTLRHVAAAVAAVGRPLAIDLYPAGTVNLLVRELQAEGVRLAMGEKARAFLDGASLRLHYPADVNDILFLTSASAGPDGRAVSLLSSRLKCWLGRLAYVIAFARVLVAWRRPTIRLTWADGELSCEAFVVAKGRFYAGPWSVAPAARATDPLLHVVALPRARRRDYLRFLAALAAGDIDRLPDVVRFSCTWLEAAGDNVPVQADGDIVSALPARFTVGLNPIRFCGA